MRTTLVYASAAAAEILGCYAFWAWWRLEKSALWLVPGLLCLALFAWLLTLVDSPLSGRTFAAYGGIYIAASLVWLRVGEGFSPDRWDLLGASVCLVGAAIIIGGPR